MADFEGGNNFAEEIAFLESMFGGTVSAAVIASVVESCGGNVHLAADAIMNFSDEMTTPQPEELLTENVEPKSEEPPSISEKPPSISEKPPTNTEEPLTKKVDNTALKIASTLNAAAPPFEFRPRNAENRPLTLSQDSLATPSVEGLIINPEESTTIRQQSTAPAPLPTTSGEQSTRIVEHFSPITNSELPTSPNSLPSTSSRHLIPTIGDRQQLPTVNQPPSINAGLLSPANSLSISFSQAFRNSGTIPKKPPDTKPKACYTMKPFSDQVDKIVQLHIEGIRTLIIMRGAAGSGKTHLAKHIVDYTVGASSQNYAKHIFSSDSYFMRGGIYQFNRDGLEEAHARNQRSVCEAANNGISPIIVDNTNTELWEMEPYIRDGVRNGYIIEFVEPNTAWARNANQLAHRNLHGVSRESIRRMLDRFDRKITPEMAIKTLRLSYPPNKKPPQLRNIPSFPPPDSPRHSPRRRNPDIGSQTSNSANVSTHRESHDSTYSSEPPENSETDAVSNITSTDESLPTDEHEMKLKKIIEAQKEIERFEIVEQEWENGESWDTTTETNNNISETSSPKPKPPRGAEKMDEYGEKLIEPSSICDDWTKISMFMPPWQDAHSTNPLTTVETPLQVEKKSVGTSVEVTDMNKLMHKILLGTPRNISDNIPDKTKSKIPLVVMLDKSTSTHENDLLSKIVLCKNTESHFRELRRMFRSVPRDILRDVFESCNFDVNWAVNLVLDSYPESQTDFHAGNDSDSEEDEGPIAECNCLAGYNIIPDVTPSVDETSAPEPEQSLPTPTTVLQKKSKRETTLSNDSLQLKRQIESNVIISDNHYSQHYLNLRRRRENNIDCSDGASVSALSAITDVAQANNIPELELNISENVTPLSETSTQILYKSALPSFPTDFRDVAGPSSSYYNCPIMDTDFGDSDTESDSNKSENLEKTVTINLGHEFVSKLDELFGRKDFVYPENIQPVVSLPMSLLQQINAHWAMSVASQLDDGSRQCETMIKQDEEFARQLADKEQEMSDEGKEPEVPTLKEIMDMEIAYAIYERSIGEWRNNEPQDLAAKLTREKLYNLFPDLSKEVLSEMLMAHGYSFKATIESLIISTGQANWLEDEKGVEKFVMHKEMKRKEKFLKEQNKNLDESEWPYLSNPDKPITLETVNFYRAEAEKSLQCRNQNFEKARQYFARNSPSAASFYSDIAALHTRRYEQSSCMAAAYLMSYHLKNNPDHDVLDLHYLRVSEAIVNLDIFIDQIVLKLRTKNIRYKETWIITGRGSHSPNGPRIKPAAKRRLKAREIMTKQIHGGLIMATLHPTDKMTSELTLDRS